VTDIKSDLQDIKSELRDIKTWVKVILYSHISPFCLRTFSIRAIKHIFAN